MVKDRGGVVKAHESRRRLLDVGHEMVLRAPSPDLLGHIRFSEVAARAGVSTGALYHYWRSQDEYRVELLGEILSPRLYDMPESIEGMVRDAAAGGIPLQELVNEVCRENVRQFFDNRDFWVQLTLWLSDDAEVLAKLHAQYRAVAEQWIEFYRVVFEVYALKLRSPYTFEWIATTLTALLEGLILRAHVDRDAVPAEGMGPNGQDDWGFFSLGVLALLPAVSLPLRAKDTDVWEWAGHRVSRLAGG